MINFIDACSFEITTVSLIFHNTAQYTIALIIEYRALKYRVSNNVKFI